MIESSTRKIHPKYWYLSVILVFFISTCTLGYMNWDKQQQITALVAENNTVQMTLASTTALMNQNDNIASTTIHDLMDKLSLTEEDRANIEENLVSEKNRNDNFANQIKAISGTVGVLDKLSKTDKELLQKYSKVYFLNEHYIPEKIVKITKSYLYNEDVSKSIHGDVAPYLYKMLDDALDDGVKIWVVSAYRSFNEQAGLKGAYTATYGSGANTFSADQGYSEHQLGTTLDFTTEGINGGLDGFDKTPAYTWLQKNASKYGFTLSYPKGNKYYVYEPWHWRFVGKNLANDLDKNDAYFYDWDQRKIDTYLVNIFD